MLSVNRSGTFGRALAACLAATCVVACAWAEDAERPADLLSGSPFDRITLVDNSVYDIEPLAPRPLPEYDPAKEKKAEDVPVRARNRRKNRQAKDEGPEEVKDDDGPPGSMVVIHLLEGEMRDYKVKRKNIKKIEYFEDMLIAEADRLARDREFGKAFERLLVVRQRDPAWSGLEEKVNTLLYEEGAQALMDNDRDRGLRLLGDLSRRKPDYPGLAEQLAKAYSSRVDQSLQVGAFAKGRALIRELDSIAPGHPVVVASTARFVERARGAADSSDKLEGFAKLDALTEAARVWPSLDGLTPRFAEAFRAAPTLFVGVNEVAGVPSPWPRSPAADRQARLIYRPLLARDDDASRKGETPGQVSSGIEVAELGRRLEIRVKEGVPWSDGSRPVSAIDVARNLTDRAVASSPGYQARWADLLDQVEVLDERRVGLRFTRSVLKPEAWLLDPVGPAHGGREGLVPTQDRGRIAVSDGAYQLGEVASDRTTFLATGPAPIRRIVELPRDAAKATVTALVRGDVSLLERVPPDRIAELSAMPGIKIGSYNRPSLHRIALDGRNPLLRNRTLRRAMSTAIDRRLLLEDVLLKHPVDDVNRPLDGPFAKGSYADAPDVPALGYDPLLARMLVAAARKELNGVALAFDFEYPARPDARVVAARIAEMLTLAGVEIRLIERPESELESALRAGRKFDLAYRVGRCAEPAWDAGPFLCPGYDAAPSADALASIASPRIRQLLLLLDRAPEWPTARALVIQIDREVRDELPILPLWQLKDHYAWRDHLKGPAEAADDLYQNIETWEVEPWFARDAAPSSP
ncbi:ABC transporter substrate-binding protein [Isosphaeraceae bacterium EP7]